MLWWCAVQAWRSTELGGSHPPVLLSLSLPIAAPRREHVALLHEARDSRRVSSRGWRQPRRRCVLAQQAVDGLMATARYWCCSQSIVDGTHSSIVLCDCLPGRIRMLRLVAHASGCEWELSDRGDAFVPLTVRRRCWLAECRALANHTSLPALLRLMERAQAHTHARTSECVDDAALLFAVRGAHHMQADDGAEGGCATRMASHRMDAGCWQRRVR